VAVFEGSADVSNEHGVRNEHGLVELASFSSTTFSSSRFPCRCQVGDAHELRTVAYWSEPRRHNAGPSQAPSQGHLGGGKNRRRGIAFEQNWQAYLANLKARELGWIVLARYLPLSRMRTLDRAA